jgi:hypothetical protein
MRSEVPENIDVIANDAQVETLAEDVAEVSKNTEVEHALDLPDRVVVEEDVAHHENSGLLLGQLHESPCFLDGSRERLFNQNILAGIKGCFRDGEMLGDRNCDDDSVQSSIADDVIDNLCQSRGWRDMAHSVDSVAVAITSPHQLNIGVLAQHTTELASPIAASDQTNSNHRAGVCALKILMSAYWQGKEEPSEYGCTSDRGLYLLPAPVAFRPGVCFTALLAGSFSA